MKVGDKAPDFEGLDQRGNTVALRDLLESGPVVVYFYPKAMTRGCTRQSCHFRDLSGEFAQLGASIVGISVDQVGRQREFDEANSLRFPLLADPSRAIARSFGVSRGRFLPDKRQTFVIGRAGTVLRTVRSEFNMRIHADQALEALRQAISP